MVYLTDHPRYHGLHVRFQYKSMPWCARIEKGDDPLNRNGLVFCLTMLFSFVLVPSLVMSGHSLGDTAVVQENSRTWKPRTRCSKFSKRKSRPPTKLGINPLQKTFRCI